MIIFDAEWSPYKCAVGCPYSSFDSVNDQSDSDNEAWPDWFWYPPNNECITRQPNLCKQCTDPPAETPGTIAAYRD